MRSLLLTIPWIADIPTPSPRPHRRHGEAWHRSRAIKRKRRSAHLRACRPR